MSRNQGQLVLSEADQTVRTARRANDRLQCLVLAVDGRRRQELAAAAREAGWLALECDDAPSALMCLQRMLVGLALVDLDQVPGGDRQELRSAVEALAAQSGLLIVLCGQEGAPQEEIWARQLGVWLYLPGVTDGTELAVLCSEAIPLAERLANRVAAGSAPASRVG
ncbi:MAG: hypothetical protein AB7U73_08035 [Pirellulales bacterium]